MYHQLPETLIIAFEAQKLARTSSGKPIYGFKANVISVSTRGYSLQ
jgi:hypothetical protein